MTPRYYVLMDPNNGQDRQDAEERASPLLLAAGIASPVLLLVLAGIVLLGQPFPGKTDGPAKSQVLPSIVVAAETPAPMLTAIPFAATPFVLRPPAPLIDRSITPAPGSEAATIAAQPACVALRTGRAPNGYRLGDGLLDIIARNHPECP